MINKENKKISNDQQKPKDDNGFVDSAKMNMNSHILIKDKDTGRVLTNKRG